MDGFSGLIAVAAFVLTLMALNRIGKLETRIAQLKLQLEALKSVERVGEDVAKPEDARPVAATAEPAAALDMASTAPVEAVVAEDQATAPEPETEIAAPPPAPSRDMEQQLASRWFVWIGGIAIAIGGLLFVKYAYDNGLISPTLQILLGLLAGACLVAVGEFVRRRAPGGIVAAGDYVPAALSAAGLATLFASIYAAYALYQIIGGLPAFLGLAAIGIGALALSRWQGPLIAALGLLGSFVTPALIPSEDPSAWSFFAYLLVIAAASFATLRGRTWWWLGYGAIAGAAAWTVLWIRGGPFEPADVWPVGLFIHALTVLAVFGLEGRGILKEGSGQLLTPSSISQALRIALVGLSVQVVLLALLVNETSHSTVALILMAAAALGWVALAWLKPGLALLAPLAGLIMLVVLVAWPEAAFHDVAFDERGFWVSIPGPGGNTYLFWMLGSAAAATVLGLAGSLKRSAPVFWSLLAAAGAFFFVWGAWARVDSLLANSSWSVIALALSVALLAGTFRLRGAPAGEAENHAAGILAAGAAALIVFLLDRLLDGVWLTMAIAAAAAAYALSAGVLTARLLGPIAVALASLTTLRLFVSRELWSDDRNLPLGQHWIVYGYGVPAALFVAASRWLRGTGHARSAAALEGISLGLFISLISLEIRVLIGGGYLYDEPQFLEMSAHILTWLGAAYGLMHRQRLYSSFIASWGARVLIAAAVAAIFLFSLVRFNPALTEAPVPGNIAFNALLLGYLAPAILIALIARRLEVLGWERLKPAAGVLSLLLAFVYVTLQTKRVYQGAIMQMSSLSAAESYAYSAVWLVFALALFVAGIRLGRQFVRLGGLAVMALVVLKVFILDLSNLEGLFRIASFVGLGLCLVGIGWLYQRFVQVPRQDG
ncbi:MAG: DUF2339 domain-containing protein [Hyphomicrobiales bacterium]